MKKLLVGLWIGGMLVCALQEQWKLFVIMFVLWIGYRFFFDQKDG